MSNKIKRKRILTPENEQFFTPSTTLVHKTPRLKKSPPLSVSPIGVPTPPKPVQVKISRDQHGKMDELLRRHNLSPGKAALVARSPVIQKTKSLYYDENIVNEQPSLVKNTNNTNISQTEREHGVVKKIFIQKKGKSLSPKMPRNSRAIANTRASPDAQLTHIRKYTQDTLSKECLEYKNIRQSINKSSSVFLGGGAYGEARQLDNSHIDLKKKLNGIDEEYLVVKEQIIEHGIEDNNCGTEMTETKPAVDDDKLIVKFRPDALVCLDFNELMIHTKIINPLAKNNAMFFPMYGYVFCNDKIPKILPSSKSLKPKIHGRILSFMPKLSGGNYESQVGGKYILESATPQQIDFDMISIILGLCILADSRTMHNDLKPDNVFLDKLRPYEECASRDLVYKPNKELYPVFYYKYKTVDGYKKLYFESKHLKHIPKLGDYGMASAFDAQIFNKSVINNEFFDYTPNFYSPSCDILYFLYSLTNYDELFDSLNEKSDFMKFLSTAFVKLINCFKNKVDKKQILGIIYNLFVTKQFEWEKLYDLEDEITRNNMFVRLDPELCYYVDQGIPHGLHILLIELIFHDPDFIYRYIPIGYAENDCVCIGII